MKNIKLHSSETLRRERDAAKKGAKKLIQRGNELMGIARRYEEELVLRASQPTIRDIETEADKRILNLVFFSMFGRRL